MAILSTGFTGASTLGSYLGILGNSYNAEVQRQYELIRLQPVSSVMDQRHHDVNVKDTDKFQAGLCLFAVQTIYGGSGLERCSGLSGMLSSQVLNFAVYHARTLRFDVFNHQAFSGIIVQGLTCTT